MSLNTKPSNATLLSLIAGILIVGNSVLLGAAATWFPWVIPTLPGSSANDTSILRLLAAIGVMFGVLVLLGAVVFHKKIANRKASAIIILTFSILGYLTGGGFIIGSILGMIGGILVLRGKMIS